MEDNRMHWLPKVQAGWLILAFAGVLCFRLSLLSWRPALLLVAVFLSGLVLTGFISLVLLLIRWRAGRRSGSAACLMAGGLGLPVLVGLLLAGMQGAKVPPIHDITTDPGNPPLFRTAQSLHLAGDNPVAYPGEMVAGQQRQAYPDIAPLAVALPPDEVFVRSLALAEKLGWRIADQDREQGVIEATDQTLVFGFTDDIVIRITNNGNGSRIDLRSASRAGVSDLGVNAKRIRSFVTAFPQSQAN
jgi:uncharacterized protein (DUF1499 family)